MSAGDSAFCMSSMMPFVAQQAYACSRWLPAKGRLQHRAVKDRSCKQRATGTQGSFEWVS